MGRAFLVTLLATAIAATVAVTGCSRDDDKPIVVQPNTTPLDTTVRLENVPDRTASAKKP